MQHHARVEMEFEKGKEEKKKNTEPKHTKPNNFLRNEYRLLYTHECLI